MTKDQTPNLIKLDKFGNKAGKDPRKIDISELEKAGHTQQPLAKIIRKKCLDCTVFQSKEVRICQLVDCPLWPYRMGVNPYTSAKIQDKKSGQEEE